VVTMRQLRLTLRDSAVTYSRWIQAGLTDRWLTAVALLKPGWDARPRFLYVS
jgi:hypothetical protein